MSKSIMLASENLIPWSQPFLDEVNWRLHQELAQMIKQSDSSVREHGLKNVQKWLTSHQYPEGAEAELKAWERVLRQATDPEIIEFMLDPSEAGILRRSNSPFAGILADDKRMQILQQLEAEIQSHAVARIAPIYLPCSRTFGLSSI